ncbi:hypothetical protein EZI54_20805 [Marinobacter halodurans]|uniref:Uncharacterized protein n=1 Tax=Marinobacter halodurans TaxID=2528979 RepID=A0ABY1ZGG8_9GAMM|nr:hypothetical protein [Marinobacter halodurans]TBW48733.1 hypothetical protein EZI54_20805 [Marinobacter halodurans]
MNTSQSIIQVKPAKELWMAKHSGPHTDEIISLFGSNILPTAFASDTPRDVVVAALRKRNPGFEVF